MSKTVGNYTLVQKLGSGSYAIVYRGVHNKTNGNYAVKVIAREKLGSTKLQENLDSEISIMRDYVHRNVVQLYDHFTSNRHIYLVLEYCGGGDLQRYIRKRTRLSETETRRFLIQLAQGLKFLHSKNIIHRDIKPQNLLLTDNTTNAVIKFADFGFAKHLVEAAMAQTPCGTPLYMAPEIFEMQEYDAKADLWSIGCVLYEMLVGMPPFKGANPRELFMNIRSKQLRIPSDVVVSADMLHLLQRLLEINPRHRIGMLEFCDVADRLFTSITALPLPTEPDDTGGGKLGGSAGREEADRSQKGPDGSKSAHRGDSPVAGLPIRRVRSREQISGSPVGGQGFYSAPPAPLSTSAGGQAGAGSSSPTHTGAGGGAATQRVSGVSPSTATMILALASSSAGGTQNVSTGGGSSSTGGGGSGAGGGHRRSGSGGGAKDKPFPPPDEHSPTPERRHSIGEASAVSRALSSAGHSRGLEAAGTPDKNAQQSPSSRSGPGTPLSGGRRASTGMTFGFAGSGGDGRASPGGDHKLVAAAAASGAEEAKGGGAAEVDDSDDFVFIEQTAVHPWRALETDYNNVRSSNQYMGSSPKNTPAVGGGGLAIPTQWYGNASGIAAAANAGSGTISQDSDFMHFSGVAHAVSYVGTIAAAMTSVADGLVRDALHRRHKLQSRHTGDAGGDDDSVRSGSSGGGSVSRQRAGSDSASLSERLCPAFAVYLHAVGLLQDIIQRTMAVAKNINRDSALQGQIDTLLESLAKRYDQLLRRADSCKKWLQEDDPVPAPEPILYKEALALGQEGSVEELLGNHSRACEKYASAKLLVECVLLTATEPSDRRVLQGFAQLFADQFTQCEKSKNALLDYEDSTTSSAPAQKEGSPGSVSAVDLYRNRTMSH